MATILVVEDHQVVADAVADLLCTLGHIVRIAYDGEAALSEAACSIPDVVVLDLGLPSIDGLQVARELRHKYGDRIRLVAQTARSDEETHREVADAGFDDIVIKPCSIYQLINAVQIGGQRLM